MRFACRRSVPAIPGHSLARLGVALGFLVLVGGRASAADKDWGGADLPINANSTFDGRQYNIRNLLIAPGVTVRATPGLTLEFDAVNIDVQGTIDATGSGLAGGGPGADGMAAGGGLGGTGPGGGG